MKDNFVLIAGFVGIIFGMLISATLGWDLFPAEGTPQASDIRPSLELDEEGFKEAYNLSESIYIPIYGSDVYKKMENGDSFILYIGRNTCPYCQQLVPELMNAAQNYGYSEIYHVDILDTNNQVFNQEQGISSVPLTIIFEDGVSVNAFIGYQSQANIESLLSEMND